MSDPGLVEAAAVFRDVSTLAEALGWDLNFRQLDVGQLETRASLFETARVSATTLRFNRRFHQQGAPPKGRYTFALLNPGTPDIPWYGQVSAGGQLISFNRPDGFDSVTPHYGATTLSIDEKRLLDMARAHHPAIDLERLLLTHSLWTGPKARRLEARVRAVLRARRTRRLGADELERFLDRELPEQVLALIAGSAEEHSRAPDGEYREQVLRRALERMEDPRAFPITVGELCHYAHCSEPTLRRVFKGRYGVTPKTYLKRRSLSAVREMLVGSAPDTKIADVANKWGYWHLGQFARDYRATFGELPSETVRRAREKRVSWLVLPPRLEE